MFTATNRDIDFRESVRMHLPAIARQTDVNDHIGACISLAIVLNHKQALKVFNACRDINSVECHTSNELNGIMNRWRDNMCRWVEIYHPQILNEVRKAL